MEKDYVLRNRDEEEIQRLHFQHMVWKEQTDLAIRLANVTQGDRIIDLGAGPGYLGSQLAAQVGPGGKVYCVDNSERFIGYMLQHFNHVLDAIRMDIRSELPTIIEKTGLADKVFCRWVFMFTGQVHDLCRNIYSLLKPEGKFISMEYFNFRHISIFPHSESFQHIYENVWKLIHQQGGDPDVGGKVFDAMKDAGFKDISVHPVYRTGKAGSLLWKWLDQTNQNHQNLADAGLITSKELAQFHLDWDQRAIMDTSFITAPPLMITIGKK